MCIPARYYRRRRPLPVLLGWDVDADGTRREGHVHALEPIAEETLVGRFWSQTVEQGKAAPTPPRLVVRDGRAVEGLGEDGTPYITADTPAEWVADLLDVA